MKMPFKHLRFRTMLVVLATALALPAVSVAAPAADQTVGINPFAAALRNALLDEDLYDAEIGRYYRERAYLPIWYADQARRRGVLGAMARASVHGLPEEAYGALSIARQVAAATTPKAMARAEIALSQAYIEYARDLNSGVVNPRDVNREIDLRPNVKAHAELLDIAAHSVDADQVVSRLMPSDPDYRRLLAEKVRLESGIANTEFPAEIPTNLLMRPGFTGDRVLIVRARLRALGYDVPAEGRLYDEALAEAVKAYQAENELIEDAVLGPATLTRLNASPVNKLEHVLVNLERHRWLNVDRGPRHIRVNIADFSMVVMDNGIATFSSDVVVGKNTPDRRTPEFNDTMSHMVINPYWHVPKSIARKEYLPLLKRDSQALTRRGLVLLNSRGKILNTAGADFSGYSEKYFPFSIKQPPGQKNALGLVKFMFPNKHNIYLHDTPAKNLFGQNQRDFSHGCIRVARPFDLAYHLLARQAEQPETLFKRYLKSGRERQVDLAEPLPVFLTYHTAFGGPDGRILYRADVYKRDPGIARALRDAGVASPALQG